MPGIQLPSTSLPSQWRLAADLPLTGTVSLDISVEPLNRANVDEAIAVATRAFVYKGEHDSIKLEYSQFAKGELTYLDPLENKEVTLVSYLALQREGVIVAAGGLYRYDDTPPGELSVGWFGVDPAHQKAGLGSFLMKKLEAIAAEHNATEVSVYSIEKDPNYPGASKLYTRLGYMPTGEQVVLPFEKYSGDTVQVLWSKYRKSIVSIDA